MVHDKNKQQQIQKYKIHFVFMNCMSTSLNLMKQLPDESPVLSLKGHLKSDPPLQGGVRRLCTATSLPLPKSWL